MTSTTVRAAAALSAVGAVLTACGDSDTLDRDTAAQHAMNAVAAEVRDPGSPVYRHRIAISSVTPHGHGGWLVRIVDHTAEEYICVVDLPEHDALGQSENLSLAPCGPAPSKPATTTTSQSA
jgi:hypothetical protein